jgi:hypothetical protein
MMGNISLLAMAFVAALPLVVGIVADKCTGNK